MAGIHQLMKLPCYTVCYIFDEIQTFIHLQYFFSFTFSLIIYRLTFNVLIFHNIFTYYNWVGVDLITTNILFQINIFCIG